MRKMKLKAALVLASLLFISCSNDGVLSEEPNPVTAVVTVTYQNGKIIKFIYQGDLIWKSDPVKSMTYYQKSDKTFIDYTRLDNQVTSRVIFEGGELVKEQ